MNDVIFYEDGSIQYTDDAGAVWVCGPVGDPASYGFHYACTEVTPAPASRTDTTTTTTVAPEVTTTTAAPEATTTTTAPQHVAVPICHATGNGTFVLIGADNSASHLEHDGGLKHGDQYPVDGACPTPATTTTTTSPEVTTTTAAPVDTEVTTTTAAPVDTEAPTTTAGTSPTTSAPVDTEAPAATPPPRFTPITGGAPAPVQPTNRVVCEPLPATCGTVPTSSSVAVEVGPPPLPPLSTTTSVGVAPVPLPATGATSADTMAAGALVLFLGAAAIVSTRIRRRSA